MKKSVILLTGLVISALLMVGCAQALPGPSAVTPGEEGNFRLLISDEKNAITDFESLWITIGSIGVRQAGESGKWSEMEPTTSELNLVDLQGLNATEIWNGNLSDGSYTMVFIYVSEIEAQLITGESVDVKLPSEKLHVKTLFNIPEDAPVDFVFDVTVVAAGNEQSGIKYILKPVVGESGPNQEFNDIGVLEELEDELTLQVTSGNVAPGESITIQATFEGNPASGALVTVNNEEIGETDADGLISLTVPDGDELKIKAVKGELEGELEINLTQD